jgi:GDPmannose 4,6-dehydratase
VREFVELAFAEVGITIQWQGVGVKECGLCKNTNRTLVRVDPHYFRPTEVEALLGNPAKARANLGWKHKIGFGELVQEMMASDLQLISERPDGGLKIDRS